MSLSIIDVDKVTDAGLINSEISGRKFNEIYKGINFYKFLHDNLCHYGFTYQKGLNIDTKQFNPTGECSEGGLYFCAESKCYHYWNIYGDKVALIEIPDDARVYIEVGKFKADRLIIKEILDFNDIPDQFWINILCHAGHVLQYIKNPTKDMCIRALQQDSCNIRYIKDQTEDLCLFAVQKQPSSLRYIKNQTLNICCEAVLHSHIALKYVNKELLTEELFKMIVQKDGYFLKYIDHKYRTEEICALAIKQNKYAIYAMGLVYQ